MKQRKNIQTALLAAFLAFAGLISSLSDAQADPLTPDLAYGYKTYFQYHPPLDKPVKYNLYPFPGPIIKDGQDIPLCAAARTPETYAQKKDMRYLLHGKNGWIYRTIDFRTDFTASPKTLKYFSRLNKILAGRGQTLVISFQPTRGMMASQYIDPADKPKDYASEKARKGYKAFLQQLNDAGIITVDLSDAPSDLDYFPKGDFHWTTEGAGYSAQKIAAVLQNIPAYNKLKKQDFQSEITGMGPAYRGAFEEFIQKTCQTNIELTTKPLWATLAAANGAADAASLLGDDSFPAITVLGASNSAEDEKFNFVGALKHYSHADIYNAAIIGGGFGSSSYRYYSSNEYHEHPPKIVIWEFLPQHNYNNAESLNAFRQMIPAVYGTCSAETALAKYSGDITSGQTEIFSRLKNQSLKNTYLYLEVTDPKERTLKVETLYKNGDADQIDLTRSTRAGNNGKYYLELGDDDSTEKNALFFHIMTNAPQGHLTARICQYPVHIAEK